MSDIHQLTKLIIQFRDQRDWRQFHKPKDLVISLMLEAAEVAEHFQWKDAKEIEDYLKKHKNKIGEELADVLYWVLLISHDFDINIVEALKQKLKKNETNYPVEKSKGKHTKYTEL